MLKKEIEKWIIQNNRIPQNLLNKVNKIPEILLNKINKYEDDLEGRCIIITGEESLYKDLTAVYFLLKYANKKKTVKYCPHPENDIEKSYAVAIMRAELLESTFNTNKVAEVISEIITNDRIFILGCESIKSLKTTFGSFSELIINSSIEFQMPEELNEIKVSI